MLKISLVRHGQASFGSDNYDQLSELGYQQARWLGEHYAALGKQFDRIVIGTQARHKQTAESIISALPEHPELEYHSGLNEYNFDNLSSRFSAQYPDQLETGYDDRRHFYAILKRALLAWSEDRLENTDESWADFQQRIATALDFSRQQNNEEVLLVSSGGAISALISQILGLPADGMIRLNLQVRNTSFTELVGNQQRSQLASFNNIPHLDIPARLSAITYS